MGTKNNPGEFDCYADAEPDEPMFVLLGRDRLGASLVALWAAARASMLANPPPDPPPGFVEAEQAKIAEAGQCVDAMKNWLFTKRKPAVDVLDMIPVSLLLAAVERRGVPLERLADGVLVDGSTVIPDEQGGTP